MKESAYLEERKFNWFRRNDCNPKRARTKKADANRIGLVVSIVWRVGGYKVPTAFKSLNACSKRITIPTCPARCQARGS